MYNDELVDLIAEAIHRHLRDDIKINTKDYVLLSTIEKNYYLNIAHDIVGIFDDYYDAELDDADEDDDEIEDELDDEEWRNNW